MAQLNPRISVYWLWLAIAFGGIAAIPCVPYLDSKTGITYYYPPATSYLYPAMFEGWPTILLCNTLAALLVAIPAAVRHTLIRQRRSLVEPVVFSLRQILLDMVILALIFGSLASHEAPPLVFFVATILYCGWPVTLIVAGAIARSTSPKDKTVESINQRKTS